MQLGFVTGAVWATRKMPQLVGLIFLLVEPENGGDPFVAVDSVGAGPGDRVLVTRGSGAKGTENLPIDARVVGIVDMIERRESHVSE